MPKKYEVITEYDESEVGIADKSPKESMIVSPVYNDFMTRMAKVNDEKRGYKHFHPSSFGDCLRKMAYQYHGVKIDKPVDCRLQRLFSAGHSYHNRIQKEFSDMGVLRGLWKSKITGKIHGQESPIGIFRPESLEEIGEKRLKGDDRPIEDLFEYVELKVKSKEYNFEGHVDGVVELIKGNPDSRYVIDFKTINSNRFARLNSPEVKYVVQIHIYMWLLDVKSGIIFYEDKNDHRLKEFIIPFSESRIEFIKDNAKKLYKVLKMGKIPKRDPSFEYESKPCCWCDFRDICWENK